MQVWLGVFQASASLLCRYRWTVLDIGAFLEPYSHTQMWSPSHCRTKIYLLRSQNSRIKWPQCNACAYACSAVSESMDCSTPGSPAHGIFQQEYCSGLPFPPSGDLSNPGTEPESLLPPALAGGFFTTVNHHFQITVQLRTNWHFQVMEARDVLHISMISLLTISDSRWHFNEGSHFC